MENDNKFLASVALFAELYNSKKDIYDVLAEFIKAAVISDAKWHFNTTEVAEILRKNYNFELPGAVINTAVRRRLQDFVTRQNNNFTVVNKTQTSTAVNQEFDKVNEIQNKIVTKLIRYVQETEKTNLTIEEQNKLKNNFFDYLLDTSTSDEYLKCISTFIIENENDANFKDHLNVIKEGLIIYTAIQYTPDINEISSWNNDLTIFLDTEILFYLAGFNGEIFKQIFDDLYNLILEINGSKSKGKISLRYFEETEKEVDDFFYVAEKIVRGEVTLDPSKSAMVTIVNGCKSADDVIDKQTKFYNLLKSKNIKLESPLDAYNNPYYNLESLDTMNKICSEYPESRYAIPEETKTLLRIFTKLNALRKGKHSFPFEQIGYILLTGKRDVIYISYSNLIKEYDRDFPLAIDIDNITNRLWFKLKKGFGNKENLPVSFDIITKAQIVLSTQVNKSINGKYEQLLEKRKTGELSKEEALANYSRIREKQIKPEEVNKEKLPEILEFINEDSFEQFSSENSLLRNQYNSTKDTLERIKIEKEVSDIKNQELSRELEQRDIAAAGLRKKLALKNREKKAPKKVIAKLGMFDL